MTGASRTIRFTLNGKAVSATVATHHTLVEMLQESFALFGARESCGQGLCGCCTVVVNGVAVSGCLYLACFADGAEVETVENLEQDGALHPLQEAFIEHGAFQCGFCTSGFLMMGRQLLSETDAPTADGVRDYLTGNLCRCGAYPEIIKAIRSCSQAAAGDGDT